MSRDKILFLAYVLGVTEVRDMTKAEVIMNDFMAKLHANEFKRDNMPNNSTEIDNAFVAKQITSYSKLLKSGIIEVALDNK